MSWAAVIAAGGAIIGGVVSSQGAKKAANASAAGSSGAINEAARQFNLIQQNTAPYRAVGTQALNALGSIYGYKPAEQFFGTDPLGSNATPYQASGIKTSVPGGSLNIGGTLAASGKLGTIGKLLDPVGSLFGNKHGDEKRNLKAFTEQNQIYDLGNGMLSLADGTQFRKDQLQAVAGTWYGATYAPDGNQAEWQQKYDSLIQKPAAPTPQPAQGVPTGGAPTAPDYSAFYKSPDYTFRRDEGTRGIERTAAARGGAFSGNALKALNKFNSNLAAGGFNDYFNHQAALAGIGQTATSETNQAGLYTGAQVGNALQNQGDARASGVIGQYNSYGNALSDLSQAAGYYFKSRGSDPNYDPSGIGYFKPTARRV